MSYRSFAAQQADKLAGISRTLHVSSRVIKYQRAEIPRTTVLDLLALSRKPRNHCRSGEDPPCPSNTWAAGRVSASSSRVTLRSSSGLSVDRLGVAAFALQAAPRNGEDESFTEL